MMEAPGWDAQKQYRQRGQELVEYALILPVLLALLLGIMELGLAVFNYNTISNAAREAARKAIVIQDRNNTNAIMDAGLRLTAATPLTYSNFTITWLPKDGDTPVSPTSTTATRVRVSVSRVHRLLTGGFLTAFGLRGTMPMTATATMYLE